MSKQQQIQEEEVVEEETGVRKRTSTAGRSPEELQAQANLRGSVGGVTGLLSVQASVAQGITSFDSAVTILVEIFGFTEEIAMDILGERTEEISEVREKDIEEDETVEETETVEEDETEDATES